jgi:hypothetical protein
MPLVERKFHNRDGFDRNTNPSRYVPIGVGFGPNSRSWGRAARAVAVSEYPAWRPAKRSLSSSSASGRPPFHAGNGGGNALRLSFSHLTEAELEAAVERLAAVVRAAD